ncbi:hypothetical protein Mapa_006788 [Marchantia paleacea]|nr:hypothetical protein Mapa_006788 [Marchantia paleacea]
MEDVQQRRQRLAAMREQAALEEGLDATASGTALAPGNSLTLPNPMMDVPPVTAVGPSKSSGFDFYTDPLTAFTNAKRRKPAVGGGVLGGAPLNGPGGVQAPPWQPTHGAPPFFQPPPMHLPKPPPPLSGNPGWQPIPYQPPFIAPAPSPPAYPLGQPQSFSNHSHGRGRDVSLGGMGRGLDNRTGGRGGYGNNFPGPGRGYSSSNNSNSNSWNSGRGAPYCGGYSARGGPARGQGRGGQRGGRTSSAKEQPHLFFKKSMVEDPWKQLEEKFERTKRS